MNSGLLIFGSKQLFRTPRRMFTSTLVKLAQTKDEAFPDPLDLATGTEKKEMLLRLAGNDDPYNLKALKRHASSKEKPIEVPSAFEARIIGCECEQDSSHIKWMWVHDGESKRCNCGHWFKLVYKEALI